MTRTWSEEAQSALTPLSDFNESLRRKAALIVCDNCKDAADARYLLEMLGLVAA